MTRNILGCLVKDLPAICPDQCNAFTAYKENEFIGAEFEVEGLNLPGPASVKYLWEAKPDGSLRPAPVTTGTEDNTPWEYVLKRPLSPEVFINRAFPHLLKTMDKAGAKPNMSGRCSVHIHVGVHELRLYQVYAMVALYYIFEDLIEPLFGEGRVGNLFCLGVKECPVLIDQMVHDAKNGGGCPSNNPNNKYTAVNLLTLSRIGTVEFRGMEGTLDPARIATWVELLTRLRTYSLTLTPQSMSTLLNMMSLTGPAEIMDKIFLPGTSSHRLLNTHAAKKPGSLSKILYQGIGRVQSLFYEVDWSSVTHKGIEDFPAARGLKSKPKGLTLSELMGAQPPTSFQQAGQNYMVQGVAAEAMAVTVSDASFDDDEEV